MTEKKLFNAVFLTLVMYGLISYFQLRSFVVPLPAFELVVFGVSIYLAFLSWKRDIWVSLLFLFFGLTQFLGRAYNFSFFLSDENLQFLSETIWVDLFFALSALGMGLLFMRQNFLQKNKLGLPVALSLLLIISALSPYSWASLIPLTIIYGLFQFNKNLYEKQHSIWAYLVMFSICRELTLGFL